MQNSGPTLYRQAAQYQFSILKDFDYRFRGCPSKYSNSSSRAQRLREQDVLFLGAKGKMISQLLQATFIGPWTLISVACVVLWNAACLGVRNMSVCFGDGLALLRQSVALAFAREMGKDFSFYCI